MAQNHTAEEDAIKANKPMTVTDGSVSFTSAPGDSSTVDVNGDIFLLNGTTANVTLAGAATLNFVGATSINLIGGPGHDVITSTRGANTFTSTAAGNSLDMTGGSGADAYRVGIGSQGVTIHDFSLAKGDTLTVDSFFKGKAIEMSDGAGGTIFEYQTGPHHFLKVDLLGVSNLSTDIIHYAHVG